MNGETVNQVTESTEELLDRIRTKNDSAAFEKLCVLYENLLSSMVRRFSPSLGIRDGAVSEVLGFGAEELHQDAAMALYRAALTYVPAENGKGADVSFGLYAKICIRNAMISLVRRYRRLLKQAEAGKGRAQSQADVGETENLVLSAETRWQIEAELSPYENKILPLYMEGLPPRRIAQVLDRTEKSVSNGIYRIKAKLRVLLERK